VSYDAHPRYPVVGGCIERGLDVPLDVALAIDGPAALNWDRLAAALPARAPIVDLRDSFASWPEIERRTASAILPGDPVFGRIVESSLADLFDALPDILGPAIVIGPGAALVAHDVLWYADLPKPLALNALRRGNAANLGQQPGGAGTEQRLFFVDWPLQDRHKQALLPRLDRYVDLSDPAEPRSITGDALRSSLQELASGPFRTRPAFIPGPWGGQWLRERLGIETEGPNLAWSYELITPESGILLESLEVGFELLMAAEGERVVGVEVAERFGSSFPIRLDYLDTMGGDHLSIQCHPSEAYMQETFGVRYTQDESYYIVDTTPGATVFLGLREDADVSAFEHAARAAEHGEPFDPADFLQQHEATQHGLYLIPGGTPHASGAGNLVLEISATPYLYTLRFYDWLRRDLSGDLRPVHLEHAFANLDSSRRGAAVERELIQLPRAIRSGDGWAELVLGRLPELFYAVHRLDFENEVHDDTDGTFHALNLVAGEEVVIETRRRNHTLSYAETIVIPASVGAYRVRRLRGPACKLVKAFVL
jgi:mannose-6-phosphate isomerase class I